MSKSLHGACLTARRVLPLVTAVSALSLFFAGPAAAADADLSCRASAARVVVLGGDPIEPVVANDGEDPCKDDDTRVVGADDIGGAVGADALRVETTEDGDDAQSESRVNDLDLDLGLATVTAAELNTKASVRCKNGEADLASDSEVAGLSINGDDIDVDGDNEQEIDVPLVGTLYLNRKIERNHRITRRALEFESDADGVLDIVIAESIARGQNCPDDDGENVDGGGDGDEVRGIQCADGVDNDGDGSVDFPGDKGCESAQDGDERTQCDDGVDNDGDGRVDFPDDMGCDSAADVNEANGAAGPGSARLDAAGLARSDGARGAAGANGRCLRRSFLASVRGNGVAGVKFYLDGRQMDANPSTPFSVRVRSTRSGRHTVTARVTFSRVSATPPKTLRVDYSRCGGASPRFAG